MGAAISESGQNVTDSTQSQLQLSFASADDLASNIPPSTPIRSVARPVVVPGRGPWAYFAGIVAVLIGISLVFFVFPRKDAEEALRAEYHAEGRRRPGRGARRRKPRPDRLSALRRLSSWRSAMTAFAQSPTSSSGSWSRIVVEPAIQPVQLLPRRRRLARPAPGPAPRPASARRSAANRVSQSSAPAACTKLSQELTRPACALRASGRRPPGRGTRCDGRMPASSPGDHPHSGRPGRPLSGTGSVVCPEVRRNDRPDAAERCPTGGGQWRA